MNFGFAFRCPRRNGSRRPRPDQFARSFNVCRDSRDFFLTAARWLAKGQSFTFPYVSGSRARVPKAATTKPSMSDARESRFSSLRVLKSFPFSNAKSFLRSFAAFCCRFLWEMLWHKFTDYACNRVIEIRGNAAVAFRPSSFTIINSNVRSPLFYF